jgi:hypothetical protein
MHRACDELRAKSLGHLPDAWKCLGMGRGLLRAGLRWRAD